ncbi:MAG: flavin reductase family protein [Anaerolineales bacterium]|jgi:flavin reductase (DIM6/NTAB) family NADH-FMN oxidoreductase RutF
MRDQVTPDELRAAMRHWATGVALVTVGDQKNAHGMTVNSLTSISLEPALILVSLERTARTHRMALEYGRFAVAILRADQKELSDIFAGRTADDEDRFVGVTTELSASGIPVPEGSLAVLDCAVEQTIEAGTHTVFIARVENTQVSDGGPPLLYFNRNYRNLAE